MAYRDFDVNQITTIGFTHDMIQLKNDLLHISEIGCVGGSDIPEDVLGGLIETVCGGIDGSNPIKWNESAIKLIVWCADAPPHGKEYGVPYCDGYHDQNPEEMLLIFKTMALNQIDFLIMQLSEQTNLANKKFSQLASEVGIQCQILDYKNTFSHGEDSSTSTDKLARVAEASTGMSRGKIGGRF